MLLFGSLSVIQFLVAFLVLHFGNSFPIHPQQPGEVLTKARRTSATDSDRSIFKLLSVATGRYVGVDSNGTLIADSSREDSSLFMAHARGNLIAVECLGSEAAFKCVVAPNGLNFTVNKGTALSALQEANSSCFMAFDPYTSFIIPNYCQEAYANDPANALVFLDRTSN